MENEGGHMLPQVVDGFSYNTMLIWQQCHFFTNALAQLDVLRRAVNYRTRWWCIPDDIDQPPKPWYPDDSGEWVEVPDSKIPGTQVKKYGLLAGRYLPGPIWNDVRQVVGFRYKPLGETYAAIHRAWKTSKTALSPAVHMNNVMANFVMADWHDVTAGHITKALRLLLGAHERDGKGLIGRTGNGLARAGTFDREAATEILNRFRDSGGTIGTWATTELQKEQLLPLLEEYREALRMTGQLIESENAGELLTLFRDARNARQRFLDQLEK
jgi:hypothetical protein